MDLSNRTVLVTGGSSGIGLGIAEAFLQAQSRVIICGRDVEKLQMVEKRHPEITTIPCDVGDAPQRQALAREVLRRFPDLDILVNNAGIQRYIDLKKGYEDLKSGEDEIAINFVSTVELTALFISHLLKRPAASIINVSSALGLMPMVNMPVYCATKAAIHTYTLVLRQQLKNTPVKVVEILPPTVETGLNQAGRSAARNRYKGISVEEYIPTVIQGLESDMDMIFHGEGTKLMSQPRGESEVRLLNPSW
jgi:uncharacterized oxidoreductase